MIKAVIFDWHGVLDHRKLESLLVKLSEISGMSILEVKEKLKTIGLDEVNVGLIEPEQYWQGVERIFNISSEDMGNFEKIVLTFEKYEEVWSWLEKNKSKYIYAILSDCPQDKVDLIRREADLSLFKIVHFSVEMRMSKRDDEFFLNILKELNLSPRECFYVDDSPRPIDTANRLGLHAILFKNVSDLEKIF